MGILPVPVETSVELAAVTTIEGVVDGPSVSLTLFVARKCDEILSRSSFPWLIFLT